MPAERKRTGFAPLGRNLVPILLSSTGFSSLDKFFPLLVQAVV